MAVGDRVYVGLLHYPVYNKKNEIVTTTITNLDLHDIARSVCTYGIKRYYVLNPVNSQKAMVKRMIDYWCEGYGSEYNPSRHEAFSKIRILGSYEEAREEIARKTGKVPLTITTDARDFPQSVDYRKMRREMEANSELYLLLFGTGWGISREIVCSSDYILQPIYGTGDYNHLSVRSAAAIILDRLFGERWWK